MKVGQHSEDPALAALVGELSVRNPDFRTWWTTHQARGPRQLTKTYLRPVAGPLTLDVLQLSVETQPDLRLVAYTAAPGSQEALRFILQWSTGVRGSLRQQADAEWSAWRPGPSP
jgi:hypothetical protein